MRQMQIEMQYYTHTYIYIYSVNINKGNSRRVPNIKVNFSEYSND